jgi:hypothetical protein
MTDQITLEEALRLVTFIKDSAGKWCVDNVHDNVLGSVQGSVQGNVGGNVGGAVRGDVRGYIEGSVLDDVCGDVWGNVGRNVGRNVGGSVLGTISGKKWAFVETPREKLSRLINESGNAELIETFNQLEDSDD